MGKHAIIVIKNDRDEYLQYFDEKWNSYLFLNCKLPDGADCEIVRNKISVEFDIEKDCIDAILVGDKKHKKFSESAKIEKEYIHYFYNVKIDKKFEENQFVINNVKYKWFSYEDLIKDERIKKVNSDIVKFVREFNM